MSEPSNILDWVAVELADLDLGDERLNQRLRLLVSQLAQQPSASLPQALSPADLKAAYRLFGNPEVELQAILASHMAATDIRCRQVPLVLAVQDTSEIDYTSHAAAKGLGYLGTSKQRGLLLHTVLALTPEGVPLGLLGQQQWVRPFDQLGKSEQRKHLPISEKESNKWLVGLSSTNVAALAGPDTTFISVADREADIYDLFVAQRAANCELLVRACQPRNLQSGEHLYDYVATQPVVAEVVVQVPKRDQQPARVAQVSVRYAQVELKPTNRKQAPLSLVAVLAEEPAPPAGSEAVRWLLLTSLEVASTSAALQVLDYYSTRWGIEVWHKVLKSGCHVEQKQLANFEHLARMITVYSILAWRVQYATMLARIEPDLSCEVVLERAEWEALYCAVHRIATPPSTAPTLAQAVRWLGQLGGFIGRKSDGEPGVVSIWRGLQRLTDMTTMYRIMRPPPLVGKV
jgi:hypothetical protein